MSDDPVSNPARKVCDPTVMSAEKTPVALYKGGYKGTTCSEMGYVELVHRREGKVADEASCRNRRNKMPDVNMMIM